MATAAEALQALNFGQPDSESEPDLDRRFVRTGDFELFLDPTKLLVRGAKGSGKSALFEMFSKHLPRTRQLAGDKLHGVVIATGSGFGDTTELTSTDIQSFQQLGAFQYDALWKVYIALKLAAELGKQGYTSNGPLRDVLRATGKQTDYRIGPMVSSAWEMVVGNAPDNLQINVMGTGATIKSGRGSVDVLDLLRDIQETLERNNTSVWMLFDKIDEIHPTEPAERNRALQGLFPACMAIYRMFPRIVPRIFIRTDIYGPGLHFTNKSHYEGKDFKITWDYESLRLLLVKRALVAPEVGEYLSESIPELKETFLENLPGDRVGAAFERLFDVRAYPGPKEANTLNWMISRATDAKGGTFPREMISYGTYAKQNQVAKGGPAETSLIAGRSVVEAYYEVSRVRYETYLSEFPRLAPLLRRFQGKHDAPFTRAELLEMFSGLDPNGDDAIEELHEVGVLAPEGGQHVSVAESFDVPRLYRSGLGLQIIARP